MPAGVDQISVESADETLIQVSVFPAAEPVAALVVVHGLMGHAGWLEASGTGLHLADRGILTLAYDRRGSGRSGGERGHARRPGDFLEDLRAVRELAERELLGRRSAQSPVHMMTQGFGARIGLPYLLDRPNDFASAILCTPLLGQHRRADYGLLDRLRILVSPAERRFPLPRRDEDYVSGGVWLDWIRADERSLRASTASFLRAAAGLSHQTRQALRQVTTPVLLLTASDDAVVRSRDVERLMTSSYTGPLRVRRLAGEHHLDFTNAQRELRSAIAGWILGGWAAP